MIGEKLIEQKPVTLAEVKQLLSERKKEKELSYEQDLTLKYAKKFSKVSTAQAEKLAEALKEVEALDPATVIKIVDILPVKKEKLQLIIPKEVVLNEVDLQKILDACKKYSK